MSAAHRTDNCSIDRNQWFRYVKEQKRGLIRINRHKAEQPASGDVKPRQKVVKTTGVLTYMSRCFHDWQVAAVVARAITLDTVSPQP